MNITDFLLRLKLTKNIGYKKSLMIASQLQENYVTKEQLKALNIPEDTKRLALMAFESEEYNSKLDRIYQQCQVISFFDDIYPMQLREIYCPPLILFAKGNIELLQKEIVVIVGSRYPTKYSEKVIKVLVPQIKVQHYLVASGLARGVDSLAHKVAIENDIGTIAVVGNGLNHFYPKENYELQNKIAETGLILSEYLPDTPPRPFRFPERNRILAGLSKHVIVTEAKQKSGSLITANIALQENRNIYAVPGLITNQLSQGPNQLIASGAIPIVNLKDFTFE